LRFISRLARRGPDRVMVVPADPSEETAA